MFKRNALTGAAILVLIVTAGVMAGQAANAATPTVNLRSAGAYAVLAAAGVTNTHAAGTQTVVNGDLGTHPTAAITGFPPGTVNGAQHPADASALAARTDLTAAYVDAQGRTPFTSIVAALGGTTLTPGVYRSPPAGFDITGTLTLNGQGDPTAVFIFQMPATTLITAASSNLSLIGSAQSCNIFWQVGSSATLGATSTFRGNILADTTISAGQNASVDGRLLAGAVTASGAVTLIDDNVTMSTCAAPDSPAAIVVPIPVAPVVIITPSPTPATTPGATTTPGPTKTPTPVTTLPSTSTSGGFPIPGIALMLAALVAALVVYRQRRLRIR
jgi:Ice-binding-like